ncbi:hypothetical protein C8U37_11362 [Trichococcus patagoniensis]|uniref:Uncharacterized protein n=1 Tax=Trichococcus patagoniensis TaxID=382641 RepID=A0A2T5IIM2_9LACT|nr:hypothetical protein C8U37_11362 [Trichococcus patagoniensis]
MLHFGWVIIYNPGFRRRENLSLKIVTISQPDVIIIIVISWMRFPLLSSIVPRGTFIKYLLQFIFKSSLYVYFLPMFHVELLCSIILPFRFYSFCCNFFQYKLALFQLIIPLAFFTEKDFSGDFYYYFTNNLNNLAIRCSSIFSYNLQNLFSCLKMDSHPLYHFSVSFPCSNSCCCG